MKTRYLSDVKKNISIYSKRKSSNILDGSYLSIFRGRTMNFDNLREYVPGDNVKDIDWKSSERCQTTLVRQYVAEKKHNIFIVMDAGIKMLADTDKGEMKKSVALYTAGTIACIANNNGDYVGLEPRVPTLFTSVSTFTSRHVVMGIRITDATISGDAVYDLEEEEDIPSIFYKNKKLLEHEKNRVAQIERFCQQKFLRSQVVATQISSRDEITEKIVNLLGRHKNANRS